MRQATSSRDRYRPSKLVPTSPSLCLSPYSPSPETRAPHKFYGKTGIIFLTQNKTGTTQWLPPSGETKMSPSRRLMLSGLPRARHRMCNVAGDSINDGLQLNMSRVDGLTVKSTCTVHVRMWLKYRKQVHLLVATTPHQPGNEKVRRHDRVRHCSLLLVPLTWVWNESSDLIVARVHSSRRKWLIVVDTVRLRCFPDLCVHFVVNFECLNKGLVYLIAPPTNHPLNILSKWGLKNQSLERSLLDRWILDYWMQSISTPHPGVDHLVSVWIDRLVDLVVGICDDTRVVLGHHVSYIDDDTTTIILVLYNTW